jgi:hypothetical protein
MQTDRLVVTKSRSMPQLTIPGTRTLQMDPRSSKRKPVMQAHCSEQPVAVLNSSKTGTSVSEKENKTGQAIYQGAILLVILLFLLSFWSC